MSSALYQPCLLCPRRCEVKRETAAASGYCGESAALRLACASIHYGEEPPLTGVVANGNRENGGGSGTIFVSGCNLGCVFCQNWQISQHHIGRVVDTAEFTRICLALQNKGAENINIVTGSHAVPVIVEGISAARAGGLSLPVLWNSSAYELPETLELLGDTVDIFLPDMKTLDSNIAKRYFNAPDYPAIAAAAIKKMLCLRPLRFTERNSREFCQEAQLKSGAIIRHLVLPDHLEASRAVLRWFADNCAGRALLSLMFQYTPLIQSSGSPIPREQDGPPNRYITQAEYDTVLSWLTEFGIEDGYCQELVKGNTDWLPDFENPNPFPSDLSVPVWHWKNGFIDDRIITAGLYNGQK